MGPTLTLLDPTGNLVELPKCCHGARANCSSRAASAARAWVFCRTTSSNLGYWHLRWTWQNLPKHQCQRFYGFTVLPCFFFKIIFFIPSSGKTNCWSSTKQMRDLKTKKLFSFCEGHEWLGVGKVTDYLDRCFFQLQGVVLKQLRNIVNTQDSRTSPEIGVTTVKSDHQPSCWHVLHQGHGFHIHP